MNNKIHVYDFEEAASLVAAGFMTMMIEEGFSTWREMVKCYWWSASDIVDEVRSILEDITDASMFDDGSFIKVCGDILPYKDFKKMLIQKFKEENKY